MRDDLKQYRLLTAGNSVICDGFYIKCYCGAWNTTGLTPERTDCYMCRRPLFRLPKALEQAAALEKL